MPMLDPGRLLFYVITDEDLVLSAGAESLEEAVHGALQGGATATQLRAKGKTARELVALGKKLRGLTSEAGALFIVNDRLDVAITVEADGVHLGADDLPIRAARKVAGSKFIIGGSVDTPEEARKAQAEGANYLGAGPVFATLTKETQNPVIGPEGFSAIISAVRIPVVGIGGIGPNEVEQVIKTGAAGVALISAVMASRDPEGTARSIRKAMEAAL